MQSIASKIYATCRWQVATIPMVVEKKLASAEAEASLRNKGKLLQGLRGSNSQVNGLPPWVSDAKHRE